MIEQNLPPPDDFRTPLLQGPPSSFAGAVEAPERASDPPVRPRVWTVFLAFFLAILTAELAGGILLVVLVFAEKSAHLTVDNFPDAMMETLSTAHGLLSTLAMTMIIVGAAALACARLSPIHWCKRLRLEAPRLSLPGCTLLVLGTVALSTIFVILMELLVPESDSILHMLEEVITGLSGGGLVAAILVIGLAPGISEELLFRGYIQTRLSARWGPLSAVVATSLLFAVFHMDLLQPRVSALNSIRR